MSFIQRGIRQYWELIKSLQTGLLLITGLSGYMSAKCPVTHWQTLLAIGRRKGWWLDERFVYGCALAIFNKFSLIRITVDA